MSKHNFGYFIHEGVSNMFSHGFMSFAAIGITVACLLIMGTFTLVAVNANGLLKDLERENEMLAFVEEDFAEPKNLQSKLAAIPNVASVTFISRQQAMERFVEQYPDEEMFQDLDPNILRDRFSIKVADLERISQTKAAVDAVDGIAYVNASEEIAGGFITLRNVATVVCVALIAILFLVSVFIISNTIRLTTFDRREEIAIMRMVGATNGFIRWPFVYEGLMIGVLGAALAFMAGHCAVEVDFSHFSYLPIAFGVFAAINLSCGSALPVPGWARARKVQGGLLLGISALLVIFGVLLNNNMRAQSLAYETDSMSDLAEAARLDPFEWADHMLTYVMRAPDHSEDEAVQQQAEEFAARLETVNSNILPVYLAEYYLYTGNLEHAFAMLEKFVDYVAADASAWQRVFGLLQRYEADGEYFREGVSHLAGLLETWNAENMGTITLDGEMEAFIARMRS